MTGTHTWRRALLIGAAVGALLGGVLADGAAAQVKSRSCNVHQGPDGPNGVGVTICVRLEKSLGRVYRSRAYWTAGSGKGEAIIYFRRISLVSARQVVAEVGPYALRNSVVTLAGTNWLAFGAGSSLLRASTSYHVCWPGFAGDPCGSQTWLATPEVWG